MPPELAKIKIELATLYERTIFPDYKILRLVNTENSDKKKIMSHFLIFDHNSKDNLTKYLSDLYYE